MLRRFLVLIAVLVAASPLLRAATVTPIDSPAGSDAMGGSLTTAPDGTVYLSWVETTGPETHALKFSRFDAAQNRWGAAGVIAQGKAWFINWADFPVLAVQADGRMTAVWFVNNPPTGGAGHHGGTYHAKFSTSADGGSTWSAPQPVTTQSDSVEFVALQPMPDGRVMALWLDSRNRATNGDRQALCANFVGSTSPDVIVDAFVCDCCQISTALTPNGLIAAYRGRSPDEVRDIRLVTFQDGAWAKPTKLHQDRWNIAACPVNGPQLFARGAQLAATWYTAARSQPRVFTKISTDGGETFGAPLRLDLGRPQGRVDNLLLADGTAVVTWLETATDGKDGGIYLRTITPAGELSEPRLVAAASESRAGGFPRSALVDAKRLLLAYTLESEPSRVVTQMIAFE